MPSRTHSATVDLVAADQIVIRRAFAAPPALVWRALTEPGLVGRWWTARRGTMTECEIDLRVGGRWRYVMAADHGQEVAFRGEYREIVPTERIVSTEAYEFPGFVDVPESYTLNTVTLTATPEDGTLLETLVRCPTPQVRDAIIESGMEAGMQDAYDLLDDLASCLA